MADIFTRKCDNSEIFDTLACKLSEGFLFKLLMNDGNPRRVCYGFRSGYSHNNWKTQCKEYNKLFIVSEKNLRHASLHACTCRNCKQAMASPSF